MELIRGKYLAAVLCAAIAVPVVLLSNGCTEECVDRFDCRGKGSAGDYMVCNDGVCEKGTPPGTGEDAGTDSGTPEVDSGTPEADAGQDAGTADAGGMDAGTTDAGTMDAGTADAGSTLRSYTASITAGQVVTTSASSNSGTGTFTYDTATNTLTVSATTTETTATTAALHQAHGGAESNMAFGTGTLAVAAGVVTGTVTLTAPQATALDNGQVYIELSDATNKLIRGQILKPGQTLFTAKLTDVINATATGSAGFILDTNANTLRFDMTLTGANQVGASHLHNKTGDGILDTLPNVGNTGGTGTITPAADTVTQLNADNAYVNVHKNNGTQYLTGPTVKQ